MKKKYIIALEDRNVWSCGLPAKTLLLSDVSIFGTDLSSVNTGIELTPYTEPDMERVNAEKDKIHDEAYARGYKEGKTQGFQEGLFETWECSRKIACDRAHGGFHIDTKIHIFGAADYSYILANYSASEAIEKIRAYEKEQEEKIRAYEKEKEEIKIGDEVTAEEGASKFVVTWMSDRCVCGVDEEGKCYSYEPKEISGRTGRRFPEIAEVLREIREEET